jgi:hypothetical protein
MRNARHHKPLVAAFAAGTVARVGGSLPLWRPSGMAYRIVPTSNHRGISR